MRSLLVNRGGVVDTLRTSLFDAPALVPSSPWLSAPPMVRPRVHIEHDADERTTTLTVEPIDEPPSLWIVRVYSAGAWAGTTADGRSERLLLRWDCEAPAAIAVSGVGRTGVEGPADLAPVVRDDRFDYPCDTR
jgi:hypothetical protein